jgi:hypothetical protein
MFFIISVPIIMAHLSRMCGGAWPKIGGLDQVLYALPFAAITFLLLLPTIGPLWQPYPWHIWVLSGISGLLAFLGKRLGHGRGISLFEPLRGDPERVEIIIGMLLRLINVTIPVWAYKCLILALCEAVVWSGMALAISPWLMSAAFIRPVAYLIGWGIWRYAENNGHIRRTKTARNKSVKRISFLPDYLGSHTAIGEFLTGLFTGFVLVYLLDFHALISMIQ